MSRINFIAYKNMTKRPVRSITLVLIAAVLSFTVFAGTLAVTALRNGFSSLENRLGADIMVVPYEAITKSNLEDMVLQGSTGYFYMDSAYLDEISGMDGVVQISAQYYLASVNSGCCSFSVEIIGIDPDTDFSVTPWIKKSGTGEMGYLDVIVGNDINAFVGDTLSFFGVEVNVIGKLDKTGTSYDTQVFTNDETIKALIDASLNKKLNEYANINSGNVISCILIDVDDDYNVEDVANEINIHNKKIEAIQTSNMISGISESLSAISGIARIILVCGWIVAFGIMIVAFVLMTGERKKEFAILRAMGASRKKVSRIVFTEGMGLTLAGSVVGVIVGLIVILPFSGYIESRISIPFLMPGAGVIVLDVVLAIALCVLAGALTSFIAASMIGKNDTGTILRSGE